MRFDSPLAQLLLALALLSPLLLAEVGGGAYLHSAWRLSGRARVAGAALVAVAAVQVARAVGVAALFGTFGHPMPVDANGLQNRIHAAGALQTVAAWAEAVALALVVRAALTPAPTHEAGDGRE